MRKIRDPGAPDRIVEAAWRTIADAGLKAATVRAIAAEAGVSTGFVMHYFADKAELAAAVFAYNNARAAARVVSAQRRHRGVSAVRAIIESLLPLDEARRLEWHVWVSFWHEGEGGGLGTARDGLGGMIVQSLQQAIDDGELPMSLDVPYEALRLMTLTAGLGLSAGVTPPRVIKAAARRMLHDHLAALAVRAGRA